MDAPPGEPADGLTLRLHPDGPDRPPPAVGPALLAAAGVLVPFGLLLLLGEAIDEARILAILVGGVVLAGAIALALVGGPSYVTAASAAAGLAVLAFVGGLLGESLTDDIGAYLLILAAAELVLFLAVPGLSGRPFLLGLALALVALALSALVGGGPDTVEDPFVVDGPDGEDAIDPLGFGSSFFQATTTLLVVGGAYLGVAALLDHRGFRRLATPFVFVGAAAAIAGAYGTAVELDETGNAVLVTVVGAVLVAVAAAGARRASMWLGVGLVAAGALAFTGSIADDSATLGGFLVLIAAALIGGVGFLLGRDGFHALTRPPDAPPPSPPLE
jgi:hypothetical protein